MTKEQREKIQELQEAQEMLHEAREKISNAIRGTRREAHTKAYLVSHLEIMTSEDHCFLSDDLNLDKVIQEIREDE